MPRLLFTSFILLFLCSCSVFRSYEIHPKTEFRGVWVATVVNIDWPKNGNDHESKQKEDFLNILNFYEKENYNAVIVQVRAAGDAFYKSEFAPWSRFLTGQEGKEPKWETSVLDWMILETHKRGMEFHAWLNPYRATFDENFEVLSETHDYCLHPEWMVHYGKKNYYNPGLPEVQSHFNSIVREITSKYNIDGIHFDDYFYPYKIKGEVFKDSSAYKEHAIKNQKLEDWRRSNIDSLIKQTYRTIKSVKPWVKFGVSPFGVWKNNTTDPYGSDTKAGQTTYDDLYADPLLWMQNGWIDYLAPQVYWSMDLPVASHRKIVDWWSRNNYNTNIYIGNGAYKVRNNSDSAWHNIKELGNQIKLSRKTPEVSGNIMFSAKSLMQNNADVTALIKDKYYKLPAFTPTHAKQKIKLNRNPQLLDVKKSKKEILFNFENLKNQRFVAIYKSGRKNKLAYPIKKLKKKFFISSNIISIPIKDMVRNQFALTFIDNNGIESEAQIFHLKKLETYGTKR